MQAVRRGLIRNLLIVPLLAGGFYVAGCKGDAKTKVETPKSQEVAGQWHGNRQAAISLTYDDGLRLTAMNWAITRFFIPVSELLLFRIAHGSRLNGI